MSLRVSDTLVAQARKGCADDVAVIQCIKESFHPIVWKIFEALNRRLRNQGHGPALFEPPTLDEAVRKDLLRALASNAIKSAIEDHFKYKLAFQNCHRVAAFNIQEADETDPFGPCPAYRQFTSIEAQLLNQTEEKRDC